MGDVAGPVGREEYARAVRLSRVAMLAAIAAAAVALLIAFGVIRLQGVMQSTEEPPIRVRNGSQDVVAYVDVWEQSAPGDKKVWHLKNYDYNHKWLQLEFHSQKGTCTSDYASADKLTVEYRNDTVTNTVEITVTGKKLKVVSKEDLSPNSSNDIISYGPAGLGYIKYVYLDGDTTTPFCTFNSAKDLGKIEVVNW